MMYRLPSVAGEWIDRSRRVSFEFEGQPLTGFPGDTLSSALAAGGLMTLARSFKYHRRRGIHSFANHDANNLFTVAGVPNVRGDVTPLVEGMRASAVNTEGGLERDRRKRLEWLAPFLPAGFYYKAFHGKAFPRWERRIRALSGLGSIDADAPRGRTPKRYAFCDVLVIGAGPSGLAAALSAAEAGAHVLLVDENAQLGGSARWSGAAAGDLADIIDRVHANHIEVLTSSVAAGYYADRWVAVVEPQRLTKVRAGAVIFATGVIEQPAVFRNNDLPGVMLGSAAQRLLHRYAIAPGRRVVILTANREGYELARNLRAQQVVVEAVLDLRESAGLDAQATRDLECHTGVRPIAAVAGRDGAVSALRADGDSLRAVQRDTIPCDALLMSVGFAPAAQLVLQSGARMEFDATLQQHVPAKLPPGVYVTGRVNGVHDLTARRQDGRDAGTEAAAHALGNEPVSRISRRDAARLVSHDYPVFPHPRGRDFVDLDEDIQVKDLLTSVQEGYDSPELLKRFSTLGMGPSQGKHSNLQGARILAHTRGTSLADSALTTQRPFYHPVPLKHLAGAGFHPERSSAAHACHMQRDAAWMTLGGWRRPEYYRRAEISRAACIEGEVRAVRETAGLIDVSTLGKIEVFGPDAGVFLDRMYAGSFSDLRVGRTRYALLLDETGSVRDDGVIARLAEQHYYCTTTTSGAANVYRDFLLWNARWRMDCTFVNGTGHRAAFNLAGPQSREILQSLVDVDLSAQHFPAQGVREARLAGMPVHIIRAGFVSTLGFEIHTRYTDGERVWKQLIGVRDTIRAFGVEAQRVLRLERGHAIVAQDTDALTNPFEAGLGWAVRMDKPFFLGQRSLRIHQQRGARQQLVGIELESADAPVLEAHLLIHEGDIAGRVTSVARSPTLGRMIGFAMAKPALAPVGTVLSVRAGNAGLVAARVVKTPFLEAA